MTRIDFILRVIQLRSQYAFSVTSWFRTEDRNAIVGGKVNSRHITGEAVDVVLDDETEKGSFLTAISEIGLVGIDEYNHIHIQKGVKT